MDLKQAKIMSASVIGIFTVVIAVMTLANNGVDIKSVIAGKINHKSMAFSNIKQSNQINAESVRWCYATYAPHGDIWSSLCYDSKKECKNHLKEDIAEGRTVNTKSCYKYEEISGYCIENVYTGETRFDDFDNSEYKVVTQVCTKTHEECAEFANYQGQPSGCYPATISVHESEDNYLTSDNVKKKILKNKPVDQNKCNDFIHAENQQQAFENLGLDWNKTKTWGAFVDTNNILRANKPSCREIIKDSVEYNKYKRN
ncbi:hypothetical protein HDR61_04685 [bacterium]|nr:hypothetical protein [bacterium]